MIFFFISIGCSSFFEAFRQPSQNIDLPSKDENSSTEDPTQENPNQEESDSGSNPILEPTEEPEVNEPTEPAEEPSEEPSEPIDTGEDMGPCGVDQICEISISNPTLFGCDSTEPQEIVFSNSGVGSLFVYHKSVYSGCCPTFTPIATADLNTSTILVEYSFTDDFCDCVCEGISVRYTLSDIPAGTYQLTALTESVTVVVE